MKADKGLIKGAAQLAQTNLIAQQQKMQAIEGFGQTFSSVYNMIQQQKNAEKLAEKELYEDQRARYKEEMKDVNDVDYSFEALNAEQVNMYREFATGKKQRYSEIFYELENKSLTQQQRNDLEFEKSVILSDLRNSAASLASATERQNKTRESYEAGDISDSNFYTDPGSMSNLYDTMMRNNFSIDERGNAIVNTNYNLKATEQANDFIKINEDIRKQVRTYGINPLEKEEDKLLRRNKIENSLDDGEVLSFMFDDLDINNGGYYDSILAKNPQLKNKFNEMRTHLSDPNKRKEAIKYFKSVVSDELMLGIDSNIQAGTAEYKAKNPDPKDDDKKEKFTGQALKNFNTREGLKDLRKLKFKMSEKEMSEITGPILQEQIDPTTGKKLEIDDKKLQDYNSYIYEVANTLSKILGSTQNNNVSYNTETEMFEIMGPSYGLGSYTLEQVLSEDDTDPNNLAYRFRQMSTEE